MTTQTWFDNMGQQTVIPPKGWYFPPCNPQCVLILECRVNLSTTMQNIGFPTQERRRIRRMLALPTKRQLNSLSHRWTAHGIFSWLQKCPLSQCILHSSIHLQQTISILLCLPGKATTSSNVYALRWLRKADEEENGSGEMRTWVNVFNDW